MKYRLYGTIHAMAKKVLKRDNNLPDTVKLVSFPENKAHEKAFAIENARFINEETISDGKVEQSRVYPVENLVNAEFDSQYPLSFQTRKRKFTYASDLSAACSLWSAFLDASVIGEGYRNAGMHYAGFVQECQQWCLPSWIWTNAALVRYYCSTNQIGKAKELGDRLLKHQQSCGGWIVRNDYAKDGVTPQLAPNDSCYIALNCCLPLYEKTGEQRYLDSAIQNARWTIATAREDGMVWFSYDTRKEEWIKSRNIVDTGFTAGLFAKLYRLTGEESYLAFLKRFCNAYIKAFYMPGKKCFSTAIDSNDRQYGGAFGRGQGWALEGLIPAYCVLRDGSIRNVIDDCVETLLDLQRKNGGWSYNLMNPMMGEDCKAVPVIAKCLLDWYKAGNPDERLLKAVENAMDWCVKHTALDGTAAGGIFSYTIEGAVVHHMYTSTAFVYGSAYALEVCNGLKELQNQGR